MKRFLLDIIDVSKCQSSFFLSRKLSPCFLDRNFSCRYFSLQSYRCRHKTSPFAISPLLMNAIHEMDWSTEKLPCRPRVGIAFDIDGVLIRGGIVLQGAQKALELCKEYSIPHIFITNGGGVSEAEKSSKLSNMLGIKIREDQMQLSHTPMQELAALYGDRPVLIVGSEKYLDVWRSYGFNKVFNPQMLAALWPNVDAGRRYEKYPVDEATRKLLQDLGSGRDTIPSPHAVMVVHDPLDWYLEIAVLLEVLVPGSFDKKFGIHKANSSDAAESHRMEASNPSASRGTMRTMMKPRHSVESACKVTETASPSRTVSHDGKISVDRNQIPFYISHTDFFGSCEYPHPRLNTGAFLLALKSLFKSVHGTDLDVTEYGKPNLVTYTHAEKSLRQQAALLSKGIELANGEASLSSNFHFDAIYAIGDNPFTDIKGANEAGSPWESILVKTGIFHGKENDPITPAHFVKEDVLEAVSWIINRHFQ